MKRAIVVLTMLVIATSAYAGTLVFDFKDKSQLAYWYMADPLRTSEPYIKWSIENEELVAVSRDVLQGGSSHIMVSDGASEEWVNYEVSCRFKIQEILEPSTKNESNAVFLIHWSIQRGEATWLSFNTRGGDRGNTIYDEVDLGFKWTWQLQPFNLPLEKGTWYTVRMVAGDNHYRMFLDDQLIIDTKGKSFPEFKSGFAGMGTKNAIIRFDDFILTGEDIPDKLEPLTQEFCSRWSMVPLIDEVTKALSPVAPQPPLVGTKFEPKDVDYAHPVYETSFDDEAMLEDWKLEGGKRASVSDGNLVLESESAQTEEGADPNHLVFWLKKEVPADFLLEFTVRPKNPKEGLNIVFFNARGINGESIFDPSLQKRNGIFKQYHSGDLNSYHVSYWAGDRGFSNLRKNRGFHLVSSGKDYIAAGDPDVFQTVQIYKRGGEIRVMVDGVIALVFDDDGKAYGPVHIHSGWIGLRQMGHTLRCEYEYVKVYPLTSRN